MPRTYDLKQYNLKQYTPTELAELFFTGKNPVSLIAIDAAGEIDALSRGKDTALVAVKNLSCLVNEAVASFHKRARGIPISLPVEFYETMRGNGPYNIDELLGYLSNFSDALASATSLPQERQVGLREHCRVLSLLALNAEERCRYGSVVRPINPQPNRNMQF